jgi:hypothetical protein
MVRLAKSKQKRELKNEERMVLRGADREAFLEAVRHPAAPSRRLVEAFRLHASRVAR